MPVGLLFPSPRAAAIPTVRDRAVPCAVWPSKHPQLNSQQKLQKVNDFKASPHLALDPLVKPKANALCSEIIKFSTQFFSPKADSGLSPHAVQAKGPALLKTAETSVQICGFTFVSCCFQLLSQLSAKQ